MTMTSEEINTFLSKPNNAIVGVNRAEGGPQLTPVWYAWDGQAFYFSTTKDRAKYLNLQRDPSISLIVDDVPSHRYVTAYGKAEILEHDYEALLRPIFEKHMPADRVEQGVQGTISNPNRVLVVLRPEKIITL